MPSDAQTRPGATGDCIQCGRCLEVCPLLRLTGREELSPRAKALLAGKMPTRAAADLAALCLRCRRCTGACPQGVDIPALVASLRSRHPDFKNWLWARLAGAAPALLPAARWLGRVLGPRGPARLRCLGQDSPAAEPFVRVDALDPIWSGRHVAVFLGCAETGMSTRLKDKAAGLLRLGGMRVVDLGPVCCGAPFASAGMEEKRLASARALAAAWREAGMPLLAVGCATCLAEMRGYNGPVFDDPVAEGLFAVSLGPLSGILHGASFVLTRDAAGVAYHQPCHAAKPDPDLELLRQALGPGLVPHDRCCGFGGPLQLAAPELSRAVAGEAWRGMEGARLVATGCSACLMQLAATAPAGAAATHWLDLFEPAPGR